MTIGWRTCENFMPLAFQSYDDVNFSKNNQEQLSIFSVGNTKYQSAPMKFL